MESDYDTKAWSRETELGRRIFNYNFRMFGREITGWELLKAVPMHRDRTLSEMTYLWQNKSAPKQQLVRVNVGELPDWRSAQKHLLGMLENSMRPDIPLVVRCTCSARRCRVCCETAAVGHYSCYPIHSRKY